MSRTVPRKRTTAPEEGVFARSRTASVEIGCVVNSADIPLFYSFAALRSFGVSSSQENRRLSLRERSFSTRQPVRRDLSRSERRRFFAERRPAIQWPLTATHLELRHDEAAQDHDRRSGERRGDRRPFVRVET